VRVSRSAGLGNVLQIAVQRGYFTEQGIDFQEEKFGSTGDAVPAIATGQLDAGSTTPRAALFNAFARGIRLTMALASSEVQPTGQGFALVSRVGPDGPVIRGPADLQGKRLGQGLRGVVNEWALDRVLSSVGLDLTDTEVVTMPFADQVAALGTGSLDGAIFPEPFGTIAQQRGVAVHVLNADSYIPGGQVAVMSLSERFADERPAVARRFSVAYLQAARDFMNALELGVDRDEVVDILAKAAGVSPTIVDQAGYFPIRRDGRVNVAGLESMLDWFVERGYVPVRPDLTDLLDCQFADYAAATLDAAR